MLDTKLHKLLAGRNLLQDARADGSQAMDFAGSLAHSKAADGLCDEKELRPHPNPHVAHLLQLVSLTPKRSLAGEPLP